MEKIPTAEELAGHMYADGSYEELINPVKFAASVAIALSKLHVEAAIKACIEDAPSGSSTDTVSYDDVVEALKDSYPLENIR
jgi:hypothetical protein